MKKILIVLALILLFALTKSQVRHGINLVIGGNDGRLGGEYSLDFGHWGVYSGMSKGSYFNGMMKHDRYNVGYIYIKQPRWEYVQLQYTGAVAYHSYTNAYLTSVQRAKLPFTVEFGMGAIVNKRFILRCYLDPVIWDGGFVIGINLNTK